MFIYQAVIMALVVIAIYLLAFIAKKKRRKFIVISMVIILAVGGVALYYVQYFFSNHYYTQNIETSSLSQLQFKNTNSDELKSLFSDYTEVKGKSNESEILRKTYKISSEKSSSTTVANIYIFSNETDADNYFTAGQSIYDNKNYIPLDEINSKKKGSGTRYLITGIKSQYRDYTDIIYLPSKIDYCSDVIIESGNVIISLSETSDNPNSNKNEIIQDILSKIKD